jgi:putative hydrolase of the HAD superfamily
MKAYLDATVFYEPRSFSQDEFFAYVLSQSKLLGDGALGILAELAASDKCMLGALNNEARETNEYRFEKFGLRSYFKITLSSCYLGLRKPDLAIYKRALDILGRPAKRILFIDDRAENVAGAVAAGMNGIRFQGAESLRLELAGLGVI